MAWERRRNRTYLYRSVREGNKVRKVYLGSRPGAQQAAEADRRRRQERQLLKETESLELLRLEAVSAEALRLENFTHLLAEAALLAIGLRRLNRRPWRPWHDGRKAITAAGDAHQT
ncbi:MAG: hypothetical protein U0840_31150 [Gemmataceae bacterium]